MMIILIAWLCVGAAHWCDWMRINHFWNLLDFVVVLPVFLISGPITTIRKFS